MKKVSVIALSAGLGKLFPHVLDKAVENYQKYYQVDCTLYDTTKMSINEVWNNPRKRAEELNSAFLDDSLYIHALIGGEDSHRILDYIDLEKANKPVLGFSDATAYLNYLAINNKKAVYGPTMLAGMAQAHNYGDKFIKHFEEVMFSNQDIVYPIYDYYVNGYVDWNDKNCDGKLQAKQVTKGPIVLNGNGIVSGKLWGGCLESLEQLKQTKYYPNNKFFDDKIIFFESSEEKPSPELIRRWIYNYCVQGVFSKCSAVMFGIPKDYSESEKETLYQYLYEVIVVEYNYDIPIIVNCPFGHTDPMWLLPYNEVMEIDLDKTIFKLRRTYNKKTAKMQLKSN